MVFPFEFANLLERPIAEVVVAHTSVSHPSGGGTRGRCDARYEILPDQNRFDDAEPHFRHYLRTSRAAGFALGVGAATGNLARLAARTSRFDDALELYDQVLAAFAERGSRGWWLEMAARKSEALVMAGRHPEAIALARDALAAGDATGTAYVLLERSLGLALIGVADQKDGRLHLEESLSLARVLGSSYEEAVTLLALAAADPAAPKHDHEADVLLQRLGVVALTGSTAETP